MVTVYARADRSLVLDDTGARYTLRIRDLPHDEKPRERLTAHGPEALSSAELLAIILGVGTVKEDVLSMTERILKEYGEKAVLRETDAARLAEELAIPKNKAQQIVAVGELGRRYFKKNGTNAAILRTAEDVFMHTADMRCLPKEHLRGLYLNAHFQVIREEVISIGTVDVNLLHPREVFKPALEYSAAAVILVHNHPPGIATPSDADLMITQQLVKAGELLGIDVLDHVIVTETGYVSVLVSA